MSGGQQARINLARAVYKKSEVYLLDDPLHALDPHVQEYIYQNCIKGFLQDHHCVLVTHNLKHKNDADRLIILKEGTIKFDGKSTEVREEVIQEIIGTGLDDNGGEKHDPKEAEVDNDESTESTILLQPQEKRKVYTEVKKVGKVDLEVFKKYFRFGGGFLVFFGIALIFILNEFSESYSSRLFTNW